MEEKKIKIMQLLSEIYEPLLEFFDIDSDKMLDEKIKVLTDLKNGKKIADIPNFYDILELYPTDMWDLEAI
jgi:hypothetical protein